MIVSPTQDETMAALRTVLLAALPAGTPVDLGQANYVPEPGVVNFALMTPIRRTRIETNTDARDDCRFIASASGTVLTVTQVSYGTVTPGRLLFGPGVAAGAIIGAQATGAPGGPGTYALAPSHGTIGSEVMACGVTDVIGAYQLDVQVEFHGDGASSQPADNAQTAAILLRDDWAVQQFKALSDSITPLYADDPRQIPFINAADVYEDRWIVEVHLQVNETVPVPQQYADSANITLIDVDSEYPAT